MRTPWPGWKTVPMRIVVQRVTRASVTVDGEVVAAIAQGLLVLLGIAADDTAEDVDRLAGKVARLRIFEARDGKFDLSVLDTGGEILVVSQFTLLADTAKGNRPGFSDAARPEVAKPLVERFCAALSGHGVSVATGVFGARMSVELANDGPVTIVLG
jgi:D-tyrosyl-tRNA(Tyr) deacylase